MPTDLWDLLYAVVGAVVGWLSEWLRQRRKQARPARGARVGLVLLVGLIAAGSSGCEVTQCVKRCIQSAPPGAAEPAPSPSPAAPATR